MRLLIGAGTPKEAAARGLAYMFFLYTEQAVAILVVASPDGFAMLVAAVTAEPADQNRLRRRAIMHRRRMIGNEVNEIRVTSRTDRVSQPTADLAAPCRREDCNIKARDHWNRTGKTSKCLAEDSSLS